MKHFVFCHEFQAIFLVGIPLILFDALLRRMPDKSKILPVLAIVALASSFLAELDSVEAKSPGQDSARERLAALQTIAETLRQAERPIVYIQDPSVEATDGDRHSLEFALPDARFTHDERMAQWRLLDNPLRIERTGREK